MVSIVPFEFFQTINAKEKERRFRWNLQTGAYERDVEGIFIITFWLGQCRMMFFHIYVHCMFYHSLKTADGLQKMHEIVEAGISYGPSSQKLLDLSGLDDYCGTQIALNLYPVQQPPYFACISQAYYDAFSLKYPNMAKDYEDKIRNLII